MRPVDIKKLSYRDELARRNRLFFILKLAGFTAALVAVAGGGVYFMFFTDKLEIKNITVNGLKTVEQEDVFAEVNERFAQKKFGYLQTSRNILFFNADKFEADILSANPVLKNISVHKNMPHELVIDIVEREPAGIWCSGSECRYFDDEMQTWGPAVKSSGFLLLTVDDERPTEFLDRLKHGQETTPRRDGFELDKDFFEAIQKVSSQLREPTIRSVVIPEGSFDEFRVYTDRSFYLIFSAEAGIESQLEVFKLFFAEESKDSGFAPQYVDLRIEGRVYFR